MNRDELKGEIGVELSSFGSAGVTDAVLDYTLEQIMGFVDSHASTERQRILHWAADECHREARWLKSAKASDQATGAASKLAGIFRTMADIDARTNNESSDAS